MTSFDGIFFHAMCDATRRRILVLLAGHDELCVCELVAALKLAQPRISSHLAALRKARVVSTRKQGLWVYYALHPQLPEWAREVLSATRAGVIHKDPFAGDAVRLSLGAKCLPHGVDA